MNTLLIFAQAEPGGGMTVTQSWMAGVVGMMLLFGVAALIGYVKKKSSNKK